MSYEFPIGNPDPEKVREGFEAMAKVMANEVPPQQRPEFALVHDTATRHGACNERIAALTQRTTDLITIIDFCDAMARDMERRNFLAVFAAHALAHRLTDDPERPVNFGALTWRGDDMANVYGSAWPDVRRRMLDLIARVRS